MLAMEVNDNAGCLIEHVVWAFIASKLAPTGDLWCTQHRVRPRSTVGASLLAMDVNDNAGNLIERVAPAFIASMLAPTGDVWCTQHRRSTQINCRSELARDGGQR